jgi:hypothetical protein
MVDYEWVYSLEDYIKLLKCNEYFKNNTYTYKLDENWKIYTQ